MNNEDLGNEIIESCLQLIWGESFITPVFGFYLGYVMSIASISGRQFWRLFIAFVGQLLLRVHQQLFALGRYMAANMMAIIQMQVARIAIAIHCHIGVLLWMWQLLEQMTIVVVVIGMLIGQGGIVAKSRAARTAATAVTRHTVRILIRNWNSWTIFNIHHRTLHCQTY